MSPRLPGIGRIELGRALWLALFALEFVFLVERFSTSSLRDVSESWAFAFTPIESLPKIGIAALTTGWILRPRDRSGGPGIDWGERPTVRSRCFAWLLHAVALAVLYASSRALFERGNQGGLDVRIWLALWAAGTCAWIVTWASLELRIDTLRRLLRTWLPLSLVSLGVGVVAWQVGSFSAGVLREPLRGPTYECCRLLLQWTGSEVIVRPEEYVLGTPSFPLHIAPECSGLDGIGLILVFTAAYIAVFRERMRFPVAWLLIPVAALVAWVCNVLRLTALIFLGSRVSVDLAITGFHSLAGVSLFCMTALGIVSVSQRCKWISTDASETAPAEGTESAAAPYLLPLIVLVATGLVTTAFPDPLDQLHPARFLATGAVLVFFWREFPLGGRPSSLAVAGGVLAWALFEACRLVPGDPQRDAALSSDWSELPVVWAWILLASRVTGTVVLAPLVEELAFRGYLTRRLAARDGRLPELGAFTWTGFLGSTIVFGLLHSEWLGALFAGAVYALVLYRTRRLIDPIVAHVVTNGIVVVHALASGRYSSWV